MKPPTPTALQLQELLNWAVPRKNLKEDGVWGPKSQAAWDAYWGAPEGGLTDRIVSLALAEVGVHETSHNSGVRVQVYQSCTWLDPGPWPWCAAFVCAILKWAKGPDQRWKSPRTAGAWDFEEWARSDLRSGGEAAGVKLVKPPAGIKRGDIVVFKFSHIDIAVEDEDRGGFVSTVEGNTDDDGGREGDGVYRKTRKGSQVRSVIRLE